MMKKIVIATAVATAVALGASASFAATDLNRVQLAQASAPASLGEVRKVDKEAKRITLRHGEIANLGMPPMTMVFRVKEDAMLDKVKVGDRVRFSAADINGGITITAIEVGQ